MMEFKFYSISEADSKVFASRQMLSYLTLSDMEVEPPPHVRPPSGKSLFSREDLPDEAYGGAAIFNWISREIYDPDGRLTFRDHTIDLGIGFEWRVRTAANRLLRTPVWSVEAGPIQNLDRQIKEAVAEIEKDDDLTAVLVEDENTPRLISYCYPKLGILYRPKSDPGQRSIIALQDLTRIPLNSEENLENPESVRAVWSPFDMASRYTTAHLLRLWEQNINLLAQLPEYHGAVDLNLLDKAIRKARSQVSEEKVVRPQIVLEGQLTDLFCAAATARMILVQHGINDKNQSLLASAMQTGTSGATPDNQVSGINLLVGKQLHAERDLSTSFVEAQAEIRLERPLKTGSTRHARAVGGFRVEADGKKEVLYIYDPYPSNQGRIYSEDWSATLHHDFMYVR